VQKYKNVELGIELSIPDDWEVLPSAWAKKMRLTAASTSEELAAILSKASSPFLYIHQPQTNQYISIPTIQFLAKPKNTLVAIGGMKNLISATLSQLTAAFPDLKCLECHETMIICGLKCGYLKATMSVKNEHGTSFSSQSEMYIIESKRALFIVGMSASSLMEYHPTETFKEILRSIKLT
jgi:hypothetical protein